jgi:hypothetical protein
MDSAFKGGCGLLRSEPQLRAIDHILNVQVLLLSAPISPERGWTSDFRTNTKQDIATVIVETDDRRTFRGEDPPRQNAVRGPDSSRGWPRCR